MRSSRAAQPTGRRCEGPARVHWPSGWEVPLAGLLKCCNRCPRKIPRRRFAVVRDERGCSPKPGHENSPTGKPIRQRDCFCLAY